MKHFYNCYKTYIYLNRDRLNKKEEDMKNDLGRICQACGGYLQWNGERNYCPVCQSDRFSRCVPRFDFEPDKIERVAGKHVTRGISPKLDDPVSHPSHYTQGKIEVIDFLVDQKFNGMAWNVVKYICRYRYKGNPVQDLKKARFYLDRLIKEEEKKEGDPRNKYFGVQCSSEPEEV